MKKRSKRQWFIPVYEEGLELVKQHKHFPMRAIAFDNFDNAYSYAASTRLTPVRDDNGDLVLDENGYAIIPELGKISVIEIDGKKIDWKKTEVVSVYLHLMGMPEQNDAVELLYTHGFNKHAIRSIREEPDNLYKASTIAKEREE